MGAAPGLVLLAKRGVGGLELGEPALVHALLAGLLGGRPQQLPLLPEELLVRLAQLAQRPDRVLVLARENRVRLLEPLVLPGEPDSGILAVHAGEGALEGGVGRHDQPHLAAGHRLEVLGDPPVGRIGQGHRQDVVDPGDREDPVLLRERLRDQRREAAVDGEPVEVDEGDVELRAERQLEHLLVDEAQLEQRVAEPEPRAPVVVDAELELRLADHVGLDEDVAQPVLLVVAAQHSPPDRPGRAPPARRESARPGSRRGSPPARGAPRLSCASVTRPSRTQELAQETGPGRRRRGRAAAGPPAGARPPRGRCRGLR